MRVLPWLTQWLTDASASSGVLHTLNSSRSLLALSAQKQMFISPLSFSMLTNCELFSIVVVVRFFGLSAGGSSRLIDGC